MWWEWVIFGIIFVSIPIGLKCLLETEKSKIINNTQKKYNKIVFTKLCCYYWLADLFYMSFIIKSIVCKFIFGGLLLLIIFYNLTMAFISNATKNKIAKVGILQDFIIGVALTIYLIYIIPGKQIEVNGAVVVDNSLREIIMMIVAAIYGGLLTLVGVAWTIKNGEKNRQDDLERIKTERQEEERKKNVPYVALVQKTLSSGEKLSAYCISIEKGKANSGFYYRFSPFTIKNISNNHIFLVGININDKIYYNSNKKLIEKVESLDVKLSCPLRIDCELNNVNLIIEDILGNKYFIQCIFGRHSYAEKWDSDPHNDTDFYEEQFRCEIQSVELPILQKE